MTSSSSGVSWIKEKVNTLFSSVSLSYLFNSHNGPTRPRKPENQFRAKPTKYLTPFIKPVTPSDVSYPIFKHVSDNTFRVVDENLPSSSKIKAYDVFEKEYDKIFPQNISYKRESAFKIAADARIAEKAKQLRDKRYQEEQLRIRTDREALAEQVRRPIQKQYTSSFEAFHDASELHQDRDLIDRKEFYRKRPLPKLTSDHLKLLDRACRYQPVDEILVELQGVRITRKDIHTLMGLNWLNDEVINFYMTLIVERAKLSTKLPKVYTFNTFFYTKLRSSGHSSLKRWTRKVDIFSYDLLTIPVHVGQNHWCLALIDFKNKKISYCDSLGGSPQGCHATLADYLRDESLDKKNKEYCLDGWEFHTAYDDIPQQKNGSDCGVFTCTYAEYLSREVQLDFEQKDMPYFRKKMIVEIMLKRLLT